MRGQSGEARSFDLFPILRRSRAPEPRRDFGSGTKAADLIAAEHCGRNIDDHENRGISRENSASARWEISNGELKTRVGSSDASFGVRAGK